MHGGREKRHIRTGNKTQKIMAGTNENTVELSKIHTIYELLIS